MEIDVKELTVNAITDNLDKVTDFIDEFLEILDCPMKLQMKIHVAIDEVFSNIVNYAYPTSPGSVTIRISSLEAPCTVFLTFIDEGIPYNPLEKTDPDTSLSAEERPIGGVGIFMVKKLMDDVRYEYVNGQNQLTICKTLE